MLFVLGVYVVDKLMHCTREWVPTRFGRKRYLQPTRIEEDQLYGRVKQPSRLGHRIIVLRIPPPFAPFLFVGGK